MTKSPSSSESNDEAWRKLLLGFHISLTILWIIGAIFLFVRYGSKDIQLNELGDYVAGVASPAAFYWLIVGFFLQRRELALQREELKEARDQFTRQASALEESNKLHERDTEHRELQKLLNTVPTRMEPITEFLLSLKTLNTLKTFPEDRTVSFLQFGSDQPSQIDVIKSFSNNAYAWPEEEFGTLLECMQLSKPHDFYIFERELNDLKRWFNETNHRALKAEAPFFYQGCIQAKLILLLKTFHNLMEPDADWGLNIGSNL